MGDLFEDDVLLQEHAHGRLIVDFNNLFEEPTITPWHDITQSQFSFGIYLASLAHRYPIAAEDLLLSFPLIQKEPWQLPDRTPEALKLFIQTVSSLVRDFDLPSINTPEEGPTQLKKPEKEILFSDEEEQEEDETQISKEEVDQWWNSFHTIPASNFDQQEELDEIAELLEDNLDYETLGEDLEGEFLKLGLEETSEHENMDDEEEEGYDDIDVALSFVLGSSNSFPKLPKGKIDRNAVARASHRIVMNDFGLSDEEIDADLLEGHMLQDDEVYHDEDSSEDSGEQKEQIDDEEEADIVQEISEEIEEEIIIEYVDEDGNVIEGDPGSDVEYEYIYEDARESEEEGEVGPEHDSLSDNEVDLDAPRESGNISDEFEFDEDLDIDAPIPNTPGASWDDLLADL